MGNKQGVIARALAAVASLTSAVASFVTGYAAMRKMYDDEIAALKEQLKTAQSVEDVDVSGLEAASEAAANAEASLAKAAVANTPASDEVHVDDGGTGTAPADQGGTVVDPATVDTTVVTDPAAQGDGTGGEQVDPPVD